MLSGKTTKQDAVENPSGFLAAIVSAMRSEATNGKREKGQLRISAELIGLTECKEPHTKESYDNELAKEAKLKAENAPNLTASVKASCTNLEERYKTDAKAFKSSTAVKAQFEKEERKRKKEAKKGEQKADGVATKEALPKTKMRATRVKRTRVTAPATYKGSLVVLARSIVAMERNGVKYFEDVKSGDVELNDAAHGIDIIAWAMGDVELDDVALSPLGRTVMDFILAHMSPLWEIPADLLLVQNGIYCIREIVVRSTDSVAQRVLTSLHDVLNFTPTDGTTFASTLVDAQMVIDAFGSASLSATTDMSAALVVSEIMKSKLTEHASQHLALSVMVQSKLRDIPPLTEGVVERLLTDLNAFGDAAKVPLKCNVPAIDGASSGSTPRGSKTDLEVFQAEMIRSIKLNPAPNDFGKVFRNAWKVAYGDAKYNGLKSWMEGNWGQLPRDKLVQSNAKAFQLKMKADAQLQLDKWHESKKADALKLARAKAAEQRPVTALVSSTEETKSELATVLAKMSDTLTELTSKISANANGVAMLSNAFAQQQHQQPMPQPMPYSPYANQHGQHGRWVYGDGE